MRHVRAYFLILFLTALSASPASSQVRDGMVAERYSFPYNGTWCWYPDGFRQGSIRYDGRTYPEVTVNIDSYLHALQFRNPENGIVYLPDPERVESLSIGSDSFRYFNGEDGRLPRGWYQILHEGSQSLYKRIDRSLEESMQRQSARVLGFEDPDYKDNVYTYFSSKTTFWHIDSDGNVKSFRSERKAAKLLAALKDDVPSPTRLTVTIPEPRTVVRPMPLAAGWFEDRSARIASESADTTRTTVTYQNKVYEIGTASPGRNRATMSGMVTDLKTGAPLEGIAVYDSTRVHWTTTGKDGRYSLTLPTGRHLIHYGGNITWKEADIEIVLHGTGELDISLGENAIEIAGASISAESVQQHRTAFIGIERIQTDRIKHIPVAFGEPDIIKAVLTMPGVQSVGEASSGFNVRGGSVDQNLVLFNGGTVYNPNHMFGIFSSFNSDVVREAELYKSSIPASMGGRISSVLDIHSREGNTEKIKGTLGVGLLTSHLCLDGPIGDGGTTFVIGGRTTYSDWILGLIPQNSYYHGGSAGFWDANAVLTQRFGDADKLVVSGYMSRDRFTFGRDTSFSYGNINGSIAWQHRPSDDFSLDISAGYDRFDNATHSSLAYDMSDFILKTSIDQFHGKLQSELQAGSHRISLGGEMRYLRLNPGDLSPSSDTSLITARRLPSQSALEPSLFVSDAWEAGDKLLIDGGIRLGAFYSLDYKAFYIMPEFRISARYSIIENLTVKAGINTMRQNIHLITNTSSISPMDTWTLVTDRIRPQDGYQAAGGVYWSLPRLQIDLSVEAYYKQSWRTLDYVSGTSLSMNEHLADDLLETKGRSYGVEFMARRMKGRLTGWASYVYSRSWLQEMADYGTRSINQGQPYRAPHDKPHNLKVSANYDFTHRYSISANVDWSTGRPVTVPIGTYTYGYKTHLAYSARNGHRIPDYFRLDLAFNVEPGHYLKQLAHMSFTIGCYNVTGRKNAYSVFFNTTPDGGFKGYMLSVFATQIPYATINLKF
ncbi:MAG: TonB-dependent receptor [Bacteroidales bacterium]|nr:TonB-dependent receptor [Bacteroidales bacterium]